MLESTRSSGYSSLSETTLTPPPLTPSAHHTLTHHNTTGAASTEQKSSQTRGQSYFERFSLKEQPVSDAELNSAVCSDTRKQKTDVMEELATTDEILSADLSSVTDDRNTITYGSSTALVQDETDSEATTTLEDTTALDSDPTGDTHSVRTITVIQELKRCSDMWHAPNAVIRSESVTQRLKLSRLQAIKKQSIIEELLQEAGNQLSIQKQANSALQQCQRRGLPEEIEAERLILLAGERYKTFQGEASRLVVRQHGEPPLKEYNIEPCTATLYLSDIRIRFSQNRQRLKEGKMEHFVCLLRERETQGITATQLISCYAPTTELEFNNRFTLPEIPHNFELSLEIYRMVCQAPQLRRRAFSHVIHSARKLSIKKHKRPCFTCTARPVSVVLENGALKFEDALESQFQFASRVTITREMLTNTAYNIEESTEAVGMEGLEVMVFADPNLSSDQPPSHGYLRIFRGEWQRRWFTLQETKLSYWLYPDQPAKRERAEGCFELARSRGPARVASTEMCGWKYSFSIPMESVSKPGVMRGGDMSGLMGEETSILLCADSEGEMESWVEAINVAIVSSTTWRPQ